MKRFSTWIFKTDIRFDFFFFDGVAPFFIYSELSEFFMALTSLFLAEFLWYLYFNGISTFVVYSMQKPSL